ncbi:MAG: GAF domain-containing protein [Crocosphaera sp.]|nr:GAF domain-containing protein [Crocosphaera sp.]
MALAEVRKQLNVQVASLFLFSKDGTIKRIGIDGIDKEGNKIDNSWFPEEEYQPGESFSGKAVPPYHAESGYGEPQYSNNLEKDYYSMNNGNRYKEKLGDLRCAISVPLNGSYRTFGTLEVLNKITPQKFEREDVYWLMMIARVVADFISLSKNKQSLEVYKELIEKLVLLEVASRDFNLEAVYQLVGESLTSDFLPYQAFIIRIPDENNDLYLPIRSKTNHISWEGRKDNSVQSGSQIVGEVYKSQKAKYIEDINKFGIQKFNNKEWIKNNQLKSLACLPLRVQDECVGTISVYTKYNHKFYENNRTFLEQIAFLTAAIISRVKIIETLQKIRKERNEIRERLLNTSILVSFDSLSHGILHQYKNELINFYQFCKDLANNSHLTNKNRNLIKEQMKFINQRIQEVTNELKTDESIPVNINTAIRSVMSPVQGNYGNLQHPNFPSPDTLIRVLNPSDNSRNRDIEAIFDTAAVMTCIPKSQVEKLGNLKYSSVTTRSFNDSISTSKIYVINIQLGDYLFTNIEVIAIPKNYALIGRDILNLTKATFDFPENQWVYDCKGICSISSEEE